MEEVRGLEGEAEAEERIFNIDSGVSAGQDLTFSYYDKSKRYPGIGLACVSP